MGYHSLTYPLILNNIFLQVHSIVEIESLGFTCTRFYAVLRPFDYPTLCRAQRSLRTIQRAPYKPSRSIRALGQSLAAVEKSEWSSQLAVCLICDAAVYSSRRHIIFKGCCQWAKKEDILLYRVQFIWKETEIRTLQYWIRDLRPRMWSERLVEAFQRQAMNIAFNDHAHTAGTLLHILRRELCLANRQHDLSGTATTIAKCLSPGTARRLILRHFWTSDNMELFWQIGAF